MNTPPDIKPISEKPAFPPSRRMGIALAVVLALILFIGIHRYLNRPQTPGHAIAELNKVERTLAPKPSEDETIIQWESDGEAETETVLNKDGSKDIFRKYERKITNNFASVFLNRPDFSAIYPGAILWWDALKHGQPNPVNIGLSGYRLPFDIVIRMAQVVDNSPTPQSVSVMPMDGSLASYANAIKDIKVNSSSNNLEFRILEAQSMEKAIMDMGMSASYLSFGKGKGSLQKENEFKESAVVIALRQQFFSIGVDVDSTPRIGGLLALRHDIPAADRALAAEIKKTKDELVYISDVAFGRAVFLLVRAKTSQKELKAAAEASASLFGIGAEGSLSTQQRSLLNEAEIHCIIAGSTSTDESLGEVLTGSFDTMIQKVQEYLSRSVTTQSLKDAVPLVFSARYVRDHASAYVTDTSIFRYWKPWKHLESDKPQFLSETLRIPPPATVISGDGELDSGDSGVQVDIAYHARRNQQGTGVSIDVEMNVTEWKKNFSKRKDSHFRSLRTFHFENIADGREIEFAPLQGNVSQRSSAKHHSWVGVKNFGIMNNVSVKYDRKGKNDQGTTELTMNMVLPFKLKSLPPNP